MKKEKGVQKMKNGRYRVQKYGTHLGVYDTIEEANNHALEAEKERELLR